MTQAQKDSLKERLVTSLIAAAVTSLVPVAFALISGLWNAPQRLDNLEVQMVKIAVKDSVQAAHQTAVLKQMSDDISLLTLLRCMEHAGPSYELYSRLGCKSLPTKARR